MNTFITLISRTIYFAFVLLLTLWIGIIVYVGLALGDYLWTIAIGFVYFFAVLPVLIFGFHRLKKTASPSKKLRIGYFLIISLFAIIFLQRLFIYSSLIIDFLLVDPNAPYSEVCFQVVSDQSDKTEAWVDIGNSKKGFSRFGYFPVDKKQQCHSFRIAREPLQIRAYSVTDKNREPSFGYRQTEDDYPTEPFNVPMLPDKTTCLTFSPVTPTPKNSYQWLIKEVSCTP